MTRWLPQLLRDLRHAARTLRRTPGTAAVVILSLGVGIGVNTAVFTWIQALVLQPVPGVRDASRLQLVEPRAENGSYPGMSWTEYRDLRARLASIRDLIAFRMAPLNVGDAGRLDRTYSLLVSGNYFSALGLRPALGRLLQPDDAERAGEARVVVVSHSFWKTRLGAAPMAIGRPLRVNGQSLTVVGVAPQGFYGTVIGMNFDLWVPATLAPALFLGPSSSRSSELESRVARGYSAIGTLPPTVTRAAAQAELDAAMRELARDFPDSNAKIHGEVMPFWLAPRGPQRFLVAALAALQVVMLLLLLTVCGNAANLVLARADARRREAGVRLALGAGRWRIVSLQLTEDLVLGVLGGGVGAALAAWGNAAFRAVTNVHGVADRVPHARRRGGPDVRGRSRPRLGPVGRCGADLAAVACRSAAHAARRRQHVAAQPGAVSADGRAGRAGARRAPRRGGLGEGISGCAHRGSRLSARGAAAGGVRLVWREARPPLPRATLRIGCSGACAHYLASMPRPSRCRCRSTFTASVSGRSRSKAARARTACRSAAFTNTVTPDYFATMGIALRARRRLRGSRRCRRRAAGDRQRGVRAAVHRGRRADWPSRRGVAAGGTRSQASSPNSLSDSFTEPPAPIVYYSYRDRPAAAGEIHLRRANGRRDAPRRGAAPQRP